MVGHEVEVASTLTATARVSRLRMPSWDDDVPITLHPVTMIRSAPTAAARSRPTTMAQCPMEGLKGASRCWSTSLRCRLRNRRMTSDERGSLGVFEDRHPVSELRCAKVEPSTCRQTSVAEGWYFSALGLADGVVVGWQRGWPSRLLGGGGRSSGGDAGVDHGRIAREGPQGGEVRRLNRREPGLQSRPHRVGAAEREEIRLKGHLQRLPPMDALARPKFR